MDWTLLIAVALTIGMIAVIVYDATHYVIPNTLNMFLLGLYPFAAFLLALNWPMALAAAGIVLVIGLGIFALGLMGGGDVKLMVVLSLFTGWSMATPYFFFFTAMFGGLLVAVVLMLRFVAPLFYGSRPLPRIFTRKQPVPYGIAIAAGFLWMLWMDQIPGITLS